MIKNFKHKGLKQLYDSDTKKGIIPEHYDKLSFILTTLDGALELDDIDMPGLDLHPLKGNRKDEYGVSVNGPWRVTFKFDIIKNEAVISDVNYENYPKGRHY